MLNFNLTCHLAITAAGATFKEYPFKDITEKIISCKRQKELEIKYKGNPIGNYRLDYLI